MVEEAIQPEVRRRVIELLTERGPLSHDELAEELDSSWDETQEIIRELRTEGLVSITIDRRYDAELTRSSLVA